MGMLGTCSLSLKPCCRHPGVLLGSSKARVRPVIKATASDAVVGGGAGAARKNTPNNSGAFSSSSSGGGGGATASAAAASSKSQQQSQQASSGHVAGNRTLLRRVVALKSAGEALDMILQQPNIDNLEGADAELVLAMALEKGNVELALAIYSEMCASRRSAQQLRPGSAGVQWPAATLDTTVALVLGLCRQLRVAEALSVMQGMRSQGMPRNEEVSFGFVVPSPLPPGRPLAVVQPQEGAKVVADSESRYEFELFSGTVTSCSSEAQQPSNNWAVAAARAVGLWRAPPVSAVHTWVVRAPDGTSRTFRAATATADVPAQVGDRVTVVSAPERGRSKQRRLLLSTAAPGMRPGEPMSVANHRTGVILRLGRPPAPGQQGGLPSWVVPAAVILAGSDAASALVDPALPALIAAGAAAMAGSALASNSLLLPRLKQLPSNAVKIEGMRQGLLAQHASLTRKVEVTLQEGSEDARALARLWQLQVKMESVGSSSGGGSPGSSATSSLDSGTTRGSSGNSGTARGGSNLSAGGGSGTYAARIGRVETARRGVEERLASRLELLDGYARVMNMIEIEVEMEIDVAAAELVGIGEQIERLTELEELQEEWRTQAEAQDEVERLLRAP